MRKPYKEGTYIAKWNSYDYLKSVYGCIISSKMIDEETIEYTLQRKDGSIIKVIDDNHGELADYVSYSSRLYSHAQNHMESIKNARKLLMELLGDEYNKAREIAENCPLEGSELKKGESVIIYPVVDKEHLVWDRKNAIITDVGITNDLRYEEYFSNQKLDKPVYLPIYTVKTEDDHVFQIYGNDFNFSGYFIGTRDDLIHLVVKMIDKTVAEIEKIEELREELHAEMVNTELDNIDSKKMKEKIDYSNPFSESKQRHA